MTRRTFLLVVVSGAMGLAAEPPRRIVSLIPAVTEMIFAMGAGDRVVGVSAYDRYPPQVDRIARVGGLIDPNVERIFSLKPDLVIVYDTQEDLKQRLDRAAIPFYRYEHRALPDIAATMRSVGARIGAADRANQLATGMEADLDAIRRRVSGEPRFKTLLVFGRDPGSLRNVYASGGYGFLPERDLRTADERGRRARRPEVIIELHYGDSVKSTELRREAAVWDALPSIPAVRNHRVYLLVGDEFVVPGPRVVNATRTLARTLHPSVFR
ncbi:MAG: hypothetical protein DMG01_05715 [Acidobacteria bacterium]|nr:MAG: hypothetical protein DMG01_05715 [Acidobacteriota bacterium]